MKTGLYAIQHATHLVRVSAPLFSGVCYVSASSNSALSFCPVVQMKEAVSQIRITSQKSVSKSHQSCHRVTNSCHITSPLYKVKNLYCKVINPYQLVTNRCENMSSSSLSSASQKLAQQPCSCHTPTPCLCWERWPSQNHRNIRCTDIFCSQGRNDVFSLLTLRFFFGFFSACNSSPFSTSCQQYATAHPQGTKITSQDLA